MRNLTKNMTSPVGDLSSGAEAAHPLEDVFCPSDPSGMTVVPPSGDRAKAEGALAAATVTFAALEGAMRVLNGESWGTPPGDGPVVMTPWPACDAALKKALSGKAKKNDVMLMALNFVTSSLREQDGQSCCRGNARYPISASVQAAHDAKVVDLLRASCKAPGGLAYMNASFMIQAATTPWFSRRDEVREVLQAALVQDDYWPHALGSAFDFACRAGDRDLMDTASLKVLAWRPDPDTRGADVPGLFAAAHQNRPKMPSEIPAEVAGERVAKIIEACAASVKAGGQGYDLARFIPVAMQQWIPGRDIRVEQALADGISDPVTRQDFLSLADTYLRRGLPKGVDVPDDSPIPAAISLLPPVSWRERLTVGLAAQPSLLSWKQ